MNNGACFTEKIEGNDTKTKCAKTTKVYNLKPITTP